MVSILNSLALRLQELVSEQRYQHVIGVVQTSIALAHRYGVDEQKAETAAWLHDMYREKSKEQLLPLLREQDADFLRKPFSTWHGPACANQMQSIFGIHDAEIEHAVRYHTIGHPDFTRLGDILYVADAIEPSRNFDKVDILRHIATIDLTLAVLAIVKDTMVHLLHRHREIDANTLALYHRTLQGVSPELLGHLDALR